MDLFIHNIDRHINNYLIRKQNNKERIFAFDHGHSLFKYWPNISLPFIKKRNTLKNIKAIKNHWGFNINAAQEVVDKLGSVPLSAIKSSVHEMPKNWLSEGTRDRFLVWWEKDSATRADAIRKGLKHQ